MVDRIKFLTCRLIELFGEDYVNRLNLIPYSMVNNQSRNITLLKFKNADILINIVNTGHIEGEFDRIDLKIYSSSDLINEIILDEDFKAISEVAWFYRIPPTPWNRSRNIEIFEDSILKLSLKKIFPEFYKLRKERLYARR